MLKLVLIVGFLSLLSNVKCSICKSDSFDTSEPPCFDTNTFGYSIEQKIEIEKSIELECYVKNKGSLHVMWYDKSGSIVSLDGQIVKPDPNLSINSDLATKFNLKITHITENYKGQYRCEISDVVPKKLIYNLDVLVPPTITRMPNTEVITLIEGDSLTVQCLTQGNPQPVLTWSKKGEKAVHTTIDESRSALSLENVNESHADTYSCTAKNGVGNPVTNEFVIVIKFKPRVVIKKADNIDEKILYTSANQKEHIICLIDSYPMPKVSLLRNDIEIPESSYSLENLNQNSKQYELIYRFSATPETFGVYTCIAENQLGISSTQLTVTPLASNLKLTNVDLPNWSDAFVFQWSLLSGSSIQELNVQVFADNNDTNSDIGKNNGTNFFTLTRHLQKDGSHSQVTYHNENIQYKDYYEITKLSANSTYRVRIRVKNDYSSEWSQFSNDLTVQTLADQSQKHKPHQIHHHRHNHGRKIKGYSQQTGSRDLNAKRDRFINYEISQASTTLNSVKLLILASFCSSLFL